MSRSMIKHIQQLTCCLVLLFAAGAISFVSADPVLVFNAATGTSGANQNQSVGWQFNVTTALTVTGLSWYDEGANGLVVGHTVGIWNSAGTLLTSVFVPAGTVGFLDGQFRTILIAPIVLPVGVGYIVGGENFSNNTERLAANVTQTVDPRITYFAATFSAVGSGFTRPTIFSIANTGFYGPSFSVAPAGVVVPEPATMMLLGSGLLGIAMKARRKH